MLMTTKKTIKDDIILKLFKVTFFLDKKAKIVKIIITKKNAVKLSLRDDITPQIIRIASSRLANKKRPLKLCYYGEVVRKKGTILRPESAPIFSVISTLYFSSN